MKCDYCNTEIFGNYCYDSWGNKIHQKHINEIIRCGSCSNIVIPNSTPRPKTLRDKRVICGKCLIDSILEDIQMMKCVNAVYEFYKSGNIIFPNERIKYKLIDAISMPNNTLGQMLYMGNSYIISILLGLNKTIFCGVLTHELMHVHLRELGIRLSLQEEEGLCEVAKFFALKMFSTRHANTQIENMEVNNNVVYGDGFRLMKEKIKQHGSFQKYLQTLIF